ncbi:MAG: hypothetical protein OEM38_11910 [Gammaproteobacteria bacterium]|nr:hypothetical protein [Gammaproteobacteria bacterium]
MKSNQAQAESQALNEELGQFLNLTSGEINMSVREASGVVQALTKTFMKMVGDVHEIQLAADKLSGGGEDAQVKQQILDKCNTYLDKVQEGTVGFQFYDKMTQRLNHTSGNIKKLMVMTEKPEALNSSDKWKSLKKDIEQSYNMEEDRVLFKALMQGDSIQEAVRLASDAQKKQKSDNTELF